jgi:hypothetical protein
MIKKFSEMTRCDEELAKYFLEQKNYNYTKALGLYNAQASQELQKSYQARPAVLTASTQDILISDDELRKKPHHHPDLLSWDDDITTSPYVCT